MEINVFFPAGFGVKSKPVNLSRTPSTVGDLINEIVSSNSKLGAADQYVIYVPARPAIKAKSSWNEAETPFASLNLQAKDSVHIKKKVVLSKVLCVSKDGKSSQTIALNVTKPVSWALQLLAKKFNLENIQNFVLTLTNGSAPLNPDASLMKQDLPGDNLSFLLRQKDVAYEPESAEVPVAPVVDIQGPAKNIKDPQQTGYLQLFATKKKKFEKYYFILKDKWLLYYRAPDAPKPEGTIPLQTFLFQLGDKDKTSKDKNKQMTLELRVDEGPKGLNLYVLKADDQPTLTKWSTSFEGLLAGALGAAGPQQTKRTLKKGAYFGVPLADTVANTDGSEIPDILEQGFRFIEQRDLKTEGIFRLSGSANVINEYKRKFDAGEIVDFKGEGDPHAVTGIIKLFLRELPEPLLTFDLYPYFMAMDGCKDPPMRLRFTRYLISRLPPLNRETLKRLMGFLTKVAQHSQVNKMALHNLATVFGPNLLGTRDKNIMQMVENTAQVNNVTNYLIQEYKAIFEAPDSPPPSGAVLARALYDYTGESELDLSLRTNEIIFVISQLKDGWWWGELENKYGRFPGSYVELLNEESAASHMASFKSSAANRKAQAALTKDQEAIRELENQKAELQQSLDSLVAKRKTIEEKTAGSLGALRTALTSYGNNVPTKLTELLTKLDDFKKKQESLQEAKNSLMHELEKFSQDLSCASTPSAAKKSPVKKDAKAASEEAEVNKLRGAMGQIWNRFIAEDVIRKKLLEGHDDITNAITDLQAIVKYECT
eukprot:TRINITY_DN5768_c0_g1_i1.p1 TRINITY_DN5768_c0_g1~~TRINITY_DN5768_c0_g1_i1.p1  ORF type:complete len:769 (+),score=198.69 TRINITY_DN5768_c0_g1_i1:59-2365(+)